MSAPAVYASHQEGVSGVRTAPLDRWTLSLLLLGAIALAAGVAVIDELAVGVVKDDGMYVVLARALASGQGYRYLNLPSTPAATHFPPGYPALLAVVSLLVPRFPANLLAFKLVNAALLAAGAVLVARLLRERIDSDRLALGIGMVSAASVPLLVLSSMVMSEPLFLAMVLALLAALERFVMGPASWRGALVLGAGIGLCMLVRSHGIVLIPAALFMLVPRRRWRDAAVLTAAAVVCVLPWQWWSAHHAGDLPAPLLGAYGPYTSWWVRGLREMGPEMIPRTLAKTVPELASMLVALFSPLRTTPAPLATLLAFGALGTAAIVAYWRRLPVTLLFLGGYVAIVAIWPFAPTRFVWGIWPLVLLLPALGMHAALCRREWPRFARGVLVVAFAWLAAGYGAYELRAVRGSWWSSIARANTRRIDATTRWILTHSTPDQVIATDDEEAVFLYTGRRTVPIISFTAMHYLVEHDPARNAEEGLVPVLARYPVDLVVVGSAQSFAVARFLANQPAPSIALREMFAGGAAFTVLPK